VAKRKTCGFGKVQTAWHLTHREAMQSGSLAGEIVESDETFIGKKEGAPKHPTAHGRGDCQHP